MGSKTSINTTDITNNDASQVQGLNAVRLVGDGNTVQVTDGEAVKNAMQFAMSNADGTAKSYADLVGIAGSIAAQALGMANKSTAEAMTTIASTGSHSASAIEQAYKTATGSVSRENMIMAAVAVAGLVLFLLMRK